MKRVLSLALVIVLVLSSFTFTFAKKDTQEEQEPNFYISGNVTLHLWVDGSKIGPLKVDENTAIYIPGLTDDSVIAMKVTDNSSDNKNSNGNIIYAGVKVRYKVEDKWYETNKSWSVFDPNKENASTGPGSQEWTEIEYDGIDDKGKWVNATEVGFLENTTPSAIDWGSSLWIWSKNYDTGTKLDSPVYFRNEFYEAPEEEYGLTINYKYENGDSAATDFTGSYTEGTPYSVNSPAITGYTANQLVVSGTMGTEDVTVTVVYIEDEYDLTINYEYENGDPVSPDFTGSYPEGTAYSVDSPAITGFTANKLVVSGIMGTEHVTVTVVYTEDEKPEGEYGLTINYEYTNGDPAATDFTGSYTEGTPYSVNSPAITGYTANQLVVSGTMGTEDVTVTVVYIEDEYDLTINYEYENGDSAAADFTGSYPEGTAYSVDSPAITGFTANQLVVSGIMGTEHVTVTVVYTEDEYGLTINYEYENGDPVSPDFTGSYPEGTAYSVDSPAITGFTANKLVVSGIMGTEHVTVTVVYTEDEKPEGEYGLTINYEYTNGDPAATDFTGSYTEGTPYSVNSPAITGYTANQLVVSGTMGTEDVTVTVVYIEDEYDLTINYEYENGDSAAADFTGSYPEGTAYSVDSPAITGFTANKLVVSGIMGTEHVTVTVVYTEDEKPEGEYGLTINYEYTNGDSAAADFTGSYPEGTAYSVNSPNIAGFRANQQVVSGTMGTEDVTVTVVYTRDNPPDRPKVKAVADDFIINQNEVLVINTSELMENDRRVDSFVSVQSPKNGTVTLEGSTVTFTPTEDFTGSASFRYTIRGDGGTDSTSVRIQVLEGIPLGAGLSYIMGYPDESFRPEREVTRGEMAAIFARINDNGIGFDNPGNPFYEDVSEDAWYFKYVQFVTKLGLFQGYDGDMFKANRPVTKAEVAQAFSKHFDLLGIEIETIENPYTDIEGHWAEEMITELYNAGISSQNIDEAFNPDRFATRTEVVVMVNRLLNQYNIPPSEGDSPAFNDVSKDYWGYREVQTASGYTE